MGGVKMGGVKMAGVTVEIDDVCAENVVRQHLAKSEKCFKSLNRNPKLRDHDYKEGLAAFKWMRAYYGK